MSTEREKILKQVEEFLEKHEMLPSNFGKMAVSDPTFVFDLRKGQDLKLSTVDKVRRFMSDYKPARPTKRGGQSAAA